MWWDFLASFLFAVHLSLNRDNLKLQIEASPRHDALCVPVLLLWGDHAWRRLGACLTEHESTTPSRRITATAA
jgi:hypothetical protein